MPPALPSLRFQPKFYTGGVSRFHLPLFYDLVALGKPANVVTLGFSDRQVHFALCQAVHEQHVACRCLTIRREAEGESVHDDEEWQKALIETAEFYPDIGTLHAGKIGELAAQAEAGSIDLLLIDDCDSAAVAEAELRAWDSKLAPGAIILMHGLKLDRTEPLRALWNRVRNGRPAAEFENGIGLGVTALESCASDNPFLLRFFERNDEARQLELLHGLIAERIELQARASEVERKNAALELRQVKLATVLTDRWSAQEVMENQAWQLGEKNLRVDAQAEELAQKRSAFDELKRDRIKAQLIMDAQTEQLKEWMEKAERLTAGNAKLKHELAEKKRVLNDAKKACRNKGRCFRPWIDPETKPRRSIPERIMRELQRIPANLSRKKTEAATSETKAPRPRNEVERYTQWIEQHEPNALALEEQRRAGAAWPRRPKISLLLPIYNAPAAFLDELLGSIARQTYRNFDVCVADAGSSDPATAECLKRWQAGEEWLRVESLRENFGIAENTNRALQRATGELFACIDQDDLLAPFALYELAHALVSSPDVDVFYSDEDRLSAGGQRHSPFFKPEWSPAFLLSSMYLGHLTAYRIELVERIGAFRKEFDLSQDYDFALRATEQARSVHHVPHVLYHWREHPASGSAGGKPQARQTNLAALADAMARRGWDAEVLEYPSANRARMRLPAGRKVSIIVPTDSPERARFCVEELPRQTAYADYELVIVTNSTLAAQLEEGALQAPRFRFLSYDRPFNFSDKCNLGAEAAQGARLIFLNDDVEAVQPDWIQEVIEPLENPEVGAVAPKLLYATGKIQHAGLVTGVRGLVGTACHQWPGDSVEYTNFAQSMRDVSALSGACLAMRREDFLRVGGFDAVNTPIAHSDLDLCFRVREAGLRCVYTPFVTMTHRGHESIGAAEPSEVSARAKPSVYFLKRWARYTCHDPFYPENMRDWLYLDSPTPLRMWARDDRSALRAEKGNLLFGSHDLSWSGAPLILLHLARWCKAQGFFVVVMSPVDGPLRQEFVEAGIPLLADPLILKSHPSFVEFAREFDAVVASTIFGAPIIRAAKLGKIPHLWWIHEGRVAEHYVAEDAGIRSALSIAEMIVTPDSRSAQLYQPFTDRPVRLLLYGIPDSWADSKERPARTPGPVEFLLLGTIEHRKGQKVFVEAIRRLPAEVLRGAQFRIVGRPHDSTLTQEIIAAAQDIPSLIYEGTVTHENALALIRQTDVMVSASWDETGPLILIEALAMGKPILSTSVGGVAEVTSRDGAGFFFAPGDAAALAANMERFVREPDMIERMAPNARSAYEKYFNFERFGEAFLELVKEAISSQSVAQDSRDPSRRVQETQLANV